jgi:ubiquinone/menaquinone biosynthesis C-methylase UbiE
MRVLDLASGTGEPSLSIAARVGPQGSVLGTDLAEPMLEFAREKAVERKLSNIEYRVGDAETLHLPPDSFDAATMRWGIMFLPDPVAGLRTAHRALRPGARMALAVWGSPERSPFLSLPLAVLKRHAEVPALPPGTPGIFAFADEDRLPQTLRAAGFHDVGKVPIELHVTDFRSGEEYWNFTKAIAGPIARLYAELPESTRARVDREVASEAERYRVAGGSLDLPGLVWVGWGTR